MAGRQKSRKAAAPPAPAAAVSIGVIADTHGVLSPVIARVFAGVTHIIHAGDIGRPAVLHRLERIAPVTAIAGNADTGKLAASLPTQASGEIGGVTFLVVHKPKAIKKHLPSMRERSGKRLIISGHLHEPSFHWDDGILFLNPGSATAPDEGDPQATVAIVNVRPEGLAVTFIPVPRTPVARTKSAAKAHAARTGVKRHAPVPASKDNAPHGSPVSAASARAAAVEAEQQATDSLSGQALAEH